MFHHYSLWLSCRFCPDTYNCTCHITVFCKTTSIQRQYIFPSAWSVTDSDMSFILVSSHLVFSVPGKIYSFLQQLQAIIFPLAYRTFISIRPGQAEGMVNRPAVRTCIAYNLTSFFSLPLICSMNSSGSYFSQKALIMQLIVSLSSINRPVFVPASRSFISSNVTFG